MVALSEYRKSFIQELNYSFTDREKEQVFNLLIDHFLAISRLDMLTNPNRNLSDSDIETLNLCVAKLNKGIPLQHVTGVAYFRELVLEVNEHVLLPRPETEELVELCLNEIQDQQRVIDLGTGSGCIGLSLKKEKESLKVEAIDLSENALKVAIDNAKAQNIDVRFHHKSMSESLADLGKFDVIISNPPYIGLDEKRELEKHVIQHEPAMALFSTNEDPLHFYKQIYLRSEEILESGGLMFLELHENYASQTAELFTKTNFKDVEILNDLQGKQRFLKAVKI